MSPRTKQQFTEIREIKKKLILDTALELFSSEGYHSTSISRIASVAGISKGLLYNYFESKEDLIKTIIFNGLDSLSRFIDPDHDGVLTKDEIRYFIEEFFKLLERDLYFWKLYFSLFLQPSIFKLVEKRLGIIIKGYFRMLRIFFENNGYDDPETEAIFFAAILDGIGFQFMINPDTFSQNKIKEKLIHMYC